MSSPIAAPRRFARKFPGAAVTAAVLLLALVLRCVAAWRWADDVTLDVDMYRGIAANLLDGLGYARPDTDTLTAYRPPLVPLIYAALGNGDRAILLFQILAGAATAGLTVRLARLLGLGWKGAGLAGAVVACDPILLRYTPQAMTEVTAALLSVGLLCRVCRSGEGRRALGGAVLTGIVFGLNALCRPTVWAFGGLLALAWLFDRLRGRAGWLHGGGRLAAGVLGVGLVVAPWVIRNQAVFDRPILMTTHGGYTLHLANNEVFYEKVVRGPAGAVWDGKSLRRWQEQQSDQRDIQLNLRRTKSVFLGEDEDPSAETQALIDQWISDAQQRGATQIAPDDLLIVQLIDFHWAHLEWSAPAMPRQEPLRDRWHRDRAIETIQSDPLGFARAVPLRVSRLWSPVPLGPAAEGLPGAVWWAVGGWNVAVFLLAGWGVVRLWRSGALWEDWRPVLLLIASVTAVHAVYWSNARMRATIVPAIAVLAAAGACGRRELTGEESDEATEPESPSGVESFGGEGKSGSLPATSR